MTKKCDLCGDTYLVEKPHGIACFRGVRQLCYYCSVQVEGIRMKHAQDAYRYGKPDWYDRLCKNVRNDLKKLYRRIKK